MSDDYAPFPGQELEDLATWMDSQRNSFYADACRNAIAAYEALNERCLRAELERDHGVKP